MTDTYLVLTTSTTTDVFPVRDIDRIYHLGDDLRVALKSVVKDGLGSSVAVSIPTKDPAEALRIATQALTDAIRTGQSVLADVGREKPGHFGEGEALEAAARAGKLPAALDADDDDDDESDMPTPRQRYIAAGSVGGALASVAGTLRIAADIIHNASRDLR